MRVLREIATEVGKGLIAGFVGTVAMTIASTNEMKLRKRAPSTVPADAAGKVLHVAPRNEAGKQRFSNLVHYAYGTGWGLGRAALGAALCAAGGRRGRRSSIGPVAFFAAVWGASLVMLPRLGV